MPTVLTTGFGPFPGYPDNASWDALQRVRPTLPAGWSLESVRLDVSWTRAVPKLLEQLHDDVRLIIAFGQADDDPIRVERFALNAPDRTLPDVDGVTLSDQHIVAAAPPAYETGLPRLALLDRVAALEISVVESHYAGGYLCNYTFFRLMHLVATERGDLTAGFIHVPPAERLALEDTRRAMEAVIETALGES